CARHDGPRRAPRGEPLPSCKSSYASEPFSMSFRLSVPSLDALSPDELDNLYTQVAALEADLRTRLLIRRPASPPDRALTLDQAVTMLGCSRAWLGRKANWAKYGGYLDLDRRVKFSEAALRAYIRAKGQP